MPRIFFNAKTQRRREIILFLCVLLFAACSDSQPVKPDFFSKSPKGVTVRSYAALSNSDLSIIDAQIDRLLERSAVHGLTDTRRHGAISIQIVPRAAQCQTPAFLVHSKGPAYDGTEYDMDPAPGQVSLCASGRYLEAQDLIQVTLDGLRSMDIVRYEGEHWLLFHSDRLWYERTKIHHAGNLHPILGD
jgi:hypothetical protein